MTIKFKATHCYVEKNREENALVLGLSNGKFKHDNYILFQRALEFDDADIELRMNSYFFEVNGQEHSNYNACDKITLDKKKLNIQINSEKIVSIDHVEVDISNIVLDKNFLNTFKEILNNKIKLQIST